MPLIENPLSKRSLPLRCFKGENIINTFIISYFEAIFPKWKNIQILTCFMFISISQRKRSLPLRCFKGKNIIIVLIIYYLWQFFQNGKISMCISISRPNQGRLTDNNSDSGLCSYVEPNHSLQWRRKTPQNAAKRLKTPQNAAKRC